MNVYLPNLRLPSTYQEVEYIQSSGTQYIDTGWTPSSNYVKVVTNMTFNGGVDSRIAVFFGMADSEKACSLHKYTNGFWKINAGSSGNLDIAEYRNGNLDVDFTLNNNSYTIKLGGSTYTGSYNGTIVQNSRTMHIFNFNELGSNTRWAYAKLYYFKIYSDANTLVRDLVPCYRKSDNVIGLYDLVNNQFYTNSGSGTFSKGSDVTMAELKNAYIGEVWTPGSNTIAYFPFTDNQNDVTGNYTLNVTGTKQTIGYQFSSGSNSFVAGVGSVKTVRFMSFWCKMDTLSSSDQETSTGGTNKGGFRYIWSHTGNSTANKAFCFVNSSSSFVYSSHQDTTIGTWYHIAYGADDNGNYKAWLNGTLVWSGTTAIKTYTDFSFRLILQKNVTATFSDLIVEDSLWDNNELSQYYNNTKSNYGL